MMRAPDAPRGALIDVNSETAQKAIAFFKQHGTVVDPTAGWGEMAGHSKEVDAGNVRTGRRESSVYAGIEIPCNGRGHDDRRTNAFPNGADSRRDRRTLQGWRPHHPR